MGKGLRGFALGLSAIVIGFKILQRKKTLWIWALIPLLLNLIMFSFFLTFGFANLSAWVGSGLGLIFADPSGWIYSLLYYPLYFILAIGFIVVSLFLAYLLASIISSPFHSVLAEKILMLNGVIAYQKFQWVTWIKTSIRMLRVSLIRTSIFAFIGVLLFLGSFLPGVNILTSFAAFVMMALDSMDFSYEMAELGFKDRWVHFRAHTATFMGMGSVIGLTLLIPGLILLAMPLLVAGSAEIYSKTCGKDYQ